LGFFVGRKMDEYTQTELEEILALLDSYPRAILHVTTNGIKKSYPIRLDVDLRKGITIEYNVMGKRGEILMLNRMAILQFMTARGREYTIKFEIEGV
jgi:hypothetical protein